MEQIEHDKIAFSFAIEDIKKGILNTLWVNYLKKENLELYKYALKINNIKESE